MYTTLLAEFIISIFAPANGVPVSFSLVITTVPFIWLIGISFKSPILIILPISLEVTLNNILSGFIAYPIGAFISFK